MVFDFLKRAPGAEKAAAASVTEVKASATGRVVAFGSSGRVAWSPRDAVSLARSGFQGNPIGFRAVKLIAEAAAAISRSSTHHSFNSFMFIAACAIVTIVSNGTIMITITSMVKSP